MFEESEREVCAVQVTDELTDCSNTMSLTGLAIRVDSQFLVEIDAVTLLGEL